MKQTVDDYFQEQFRHASAKREELEAMLDECDHAAVAWPLLT